MRGKRSKAYKKLMTQYHHVFGFREPYQVLVDSQMIQEAAKCTMDLAPALERTLRGTVKPMITQCSIRHLYTCDLPNKQQLIETAKTFTRRKCGHHELETPLTETECFDACVNIKGENKHRYCVAVQDREVRAKMRDIPGVPMIVINRSVMILEPMTEKSLFKKDSMERKKFREGIVDARVAVHGEKKKKKKRKGPSGPNPLSVKKKKPKPTQGQDRSKPAEGEQDGAAKKRRKRKHGKAGEGAPQSAAQPAP
ncbi:hypothetical protein EX30DRAFT_140590 [Ascodesmis nigricans]|uniref:U three protein 23 n=1 Tax=Ascodesmis nigricans TaxID=341454 RepID=A0A4S2N1A7_9PEZI|nr:hypothetical protein EX30DRAFT_140590 [Ascodesmis nigricans]